MTFRPHPDKLLHPETAPPLLTSHEHKLSLLAGHGLDGAVVLSFTHDVAALEPQAFVDLLVDGIPALAEVMVGRNWRFGKGGRGNTRVLACLGLSRGINVRVVSPVTRRRKAISSTRIRREIMRGSLDEAALMLGRRYSLLGSVVADRGVGRRLGYPTANLDVHNEVLPPEGVYAVRVVAGRQKRDGVMSIGSRPTFRRGGAGDTSVEVHLMDFSGQLYGRSMEVLIVQKIRTQMAFRSPGQLKKRIEQDVVIARRILAGQPIQKW